MNYFVTDIAAKQYAQGRPDFHAKTIRHIQRFLRLDGKLERALDVACGTGLSTKALLEIAASVDGTDNAEEMLRLAHKAKGIQYATAPAEHQPFADLSFDLITVCSGVHWFDIDAFLLESRRLLRPQAWLVLYDNFFLGDMNSNEDFRKWHEDEYLTKFPPPPRNNNYEWTKLHLSGKALDFIGEEQFNNSVVFDKKGLVRYFITQSNIIAASQGDSQTCELIGQWLDKELESFFPDTNQSASFLFGNWIKYIRKQ